MTTLITDPLLEERVKNERKACDADRYDEVWEGVYMMTPLPNDEHQQIVARLCSIFQEILGWPGLGEVRPGVNLVDLQEEGWEHNYRAPDVAVFLRGGSAKNCGTHWRGAADFLVEIISPNDRSREKIPFYSRLGVLELLLVDREPWALELYQRREGQLQKTGQSTLAASEVLASGVVPLRFQLVAGDPRPHIAVTHVGSGRGWSV